MIPPRFHCATIVIWVLLGMLISADSPWTLAWAESTTADQVSVTALERVAEQIADPPQREQLLQTLRTLIAVAKQRQTGPESQTSGTFVSSQSHDVFLAFGRFTQSLATVGSRLGAGLKAIYRQLADLSAHARDPAMIGWAVLVAAAALALVALGIVLQRFADKMQERLRRRASLGERLLRWRKVWSVLAELGVAAAPYVTLLLISGLLFSLLPVGPLPPSLAALVISTLLLYRLASTGALLLLNPDRASARLLPLDDARAQGAWRSVKRLLVLGAIYFIITRALLMVGAAGAAYHIVRGVLIVTAASLVSLLVWHWRGTQRSAAATPSGPRRLASNLPLALRSAWPIITITYIWGATALALLGLQRSTTFLLEAYLEMALVIGVGMILLMMSDLLFERAASLDQRVGHYLPGLETRMLQYVRLARWSVRMVVILAALLIILQVWGIGIGWLFTSPLGSVLFPRLIVLLVTVVIVIVVMDLSSFIGQRLIEPRGAGLEVSRKRKTLVPLVAAVLKYSALFAGSMIVLHHIGVNVTPILGGVGILSLAVGFGAQTLVKDIINGLFILVEDSLAVGDVVSIRGIGGVVEAVNLRTIQLRDVQGSVHVMPNSQIDAISNMTKDFGYYVLNVGVAYHEDIDEVIAVLQKIDAEMREDPAFAPEMLGPIEIFGIERFTDSAVVIGGRLKTKALKQWTVGREFNRRMKKAFEARGIEMPYPQRTISWAASKDSATVPLELHIRDLNTLTMQEQGEQPPTAHGRDQPEA